MPHELLRGLVARWDGRFRWTPPAVEGMFTLLVLAATRSTWSSVKGVAGVVRCRSFLARSPPGEAYLLTYYVIQLLVWVNG